MTTTSHNLLSPGPSEVGLAKHEYSADQTTAQYVAVKH